MMFAKESGIAEPDVPGKPVILRADTEVKALPPKGRNETTACLRYRFVYEIQLAGNWALTQVARGCVRVRNPRMR
jgi:hypothetical protein